jgi:hypothetical protein
MLGPAGKAVKLAQARAALSVPAPDPVTGGIGGGVHAAHRPDRVGALHALRQGRICADGGDCADSPFARLSRGPP